ncbi:MAG: ABC transporter ATP-binding protein [Proteobacteria bacterium]|nr:ABC transporter ATP-binding protein [Pseudomonadota bacterium]
MSGLSLQRITKSFGATAVLKGVSLDVAPGEFLTLLGPSGCGKSTLLRVIAGLEAHDSGSVSIGGAQVDGERPKYRDVAMVFQSYALYPHMTVAQNLALPLRMRQLSAAQRLPLVGRWLPGTRGRTEAIDHEVRRTAAALEIGHLLDRKPGQLSGGQRQRVALGRAMVRHPAIFLMDEPLSNLDAKLRVATRAEIKELHQRLGATFVYVTHDQSEAMTLSDRVAVMLDGELLQVASPREIYAEPADRRVAEFIGSPKINMLTGRVRDRDFVDVAGATLSLRTGVASGGTIRLGIRPEAFQLADGTTSGTLATRLRFVEHLGSDLFVHLDAPGEAEPLIARLDAERTPDLVPGSTVHLEVRPGRILLFDEAGCRIRLERPRIAALRSYA